jgi:hypothetical protein
MFLEFTAIGAFTLAELAQETKEPQQTDSKYRNQ